MGKKISHGLSASQFFLFFLLLWMLCCIGSFIWKKIDFIWALMCVVISNRAFDMWVCICAFASHTMHVNITFEIWFFFSSSIQIHTIKYPPTMSTHSCLFFLPAIPTHTIRFPHARFRFGFVIVHNKPKSMMNGWHVFVSWIDAQSFSLCRVYVC